MYLELFCASPSKGSIFDAMLRGSFTVFIPGGPSCLGGKALCSYLLPTLQIVLIRRLVLRVNVGNVSYPGDTVRGHKNQLFVVFCFWTMLVDLKTSAW